MTAYLLVNHLLNFMAPAAFLALAMVAFPRCWPFTRVLAGGKSKAGTSWRRQFGILLMVNLAVAVAGLLVFRHDGKLLTYGAMALASALVQGLRRR